MTGARALAPDARAAPTVRAHERRGLRKSAALNVYASKEHRDANRAKHKCRPSIVPRVPTVHAPS